MIEIEILYTKKIFSFPFSDDTKIFVFINILVLFLNITTKIAVF